MRLLILLLLAGCATPAQRQAEQDAYVARLEQACASMGYERNSEAGVQCGLRLHNQLQASRPAPIPYQSFRRQAPSVITNCNRDPWGNVTCVSQ